MPEIDDGTSAMNVGGHLCGKPVASCLPHIAPKSTQPWVVFQVLPIQQKVVNQGGKFIVPYLWVHLLLDWVHVCM